MTGSITAVPPIVQYWHEESPPDYMDELLQTFRERNPGLDHLLFSRPAAAEFIAERFGDRELAAFQACAVPAMQADYLRYCAVLALGGIYSDADFECVASLAPLLPDPGHGRLFRGRGGNVTNNVFAFAAPGHPFLELALEIATVNIERRRFDRVYLATGPPIFMTLCWLRAYGSLDRLLDSAVATRFGEFVFPYCETVRKYGGVDRAFDGVEISAVAAQDRFVRLPGRPLPYKRSDVHWVGYGDGIFS